MRSSRAGVRRSWRRARRSDRSVCRRRGGRPTARASVPTRVTLPVSRRSGNASTRIAAACPGRTRCTSASLTDASSSMRLTSGIVTSPWLPVTRSPTPDLPARVRAQELLEHDQPGPARVDAAVLDLIDEQLSRAPAASWPWRAHSRTARPFAPAAAPPAVCRADARAADHDVGAPLRQRELLLALLELVGRLLQLLARDEAFLQQRLQLLVLLAKPARLFLRELQARACFFDAQRAFALGHRLRPRPRPPAARCRRPAVRAATGGLPAGAVRGRVGGPSCRGGRAGRLRSRACPPARAR